MYNWEYSVITYGENFTLYLNGLYFFEKHSTQNVIEGYDIASCTLGTGRISISRDDTRLEFVLREQVRYGDAPWPGTVE